MKIRFTTIILAALTALAGTSCNKNETAPVQDFSTPRILAHRGGRAEQDENTLAAFKATYEAGCHGFETDIRFDSDRDFVIMHDRTLDRRTDGEGKVEESTTAYIRGLKTKDGNKVAFLEDLTSYFKGCRTLYVEWELKTGDYTEEMLDEYCSRVYPAVMDGKPSDALYIFSSFDERPLVRLKKSHPEAELMLITSQPVSRAFVDRCISLGIHRCACHLDGSTREAVRYAHRYDVKVNLWPGTRPGDTALAYYLGADYSCTDIPQAVMGYIREHSLNITCEGVARHPKRLVCMDLDGTLTQHKTHLTPEVKAALDSLGRIYHLLMVGGGSATRIHDQMDGYPIDILGNYGMQEARVIDGQWQIVRRDTVAVDREEVLAKCKALREKYGYTEYRGGSVEFQKGGMMTFALLGTEAPKDAKLAFDPDKKKRREMYKDVCNAFPDWSVFIGGTTSFDLAPKQYNKYDAIMRYAAENGYSKDEIVFFGDDLTEGGNDSHVRFGGIECIRIEDYASFPAMAATL